MANIHGLGSINNNNTNYQQLRPQQNQPNLNIPFLQNSQGDPRDENFGSMLINTFCPRLRLFSLTTFLIILITSLYIAMLSVGGINKKSSFLLVQRDTLSNFGGNSSYEIRYNGKIYTWFTSIFLVQDFLQWITTCIYIMIFASPLEKSYGYRLLMLIYVCGGACGAIFGDVTQCCQIDAYCECQSALYSLVGAYIATLILNWDKLDALGPLKMFMVCIIIMMIIFLILFAFSAQYLYTDNLGSLGGFLGGLFIALIAIEIPNSGQFQKQARMVGIGLLTFYVVLCVILLFTLHYN